MTETGLFTDKTEINMLKEDLEDIKQLMKEEMLKTIKNDLHSEMIFVYVDNLEQENKQLKEDKKKAIEYIKEHNVIATNKEYLPKDYEYCCSYELLEILGDK